MELKSNELRIGNYLDYYDQTVSVQKILINNDIECGYFKDSIGFVRKLTEKHSPKPIPLTEDWLIKFGFEYDRMNGFCKEYTIYQNGNNPFIVLLGSKGWHWWSHQQYYYKHVHQLQNLYFALTQKELTF